jgi:energy-coupling factor transporter ATP-binding protein EcfA2
VLELVNSGSLDLRLAALLWLMMEYRAPVLVAAGPSNAGKSTTLNVLLDFLPPEVKEVHLRGEGEDFAFLDNSVAAQTYMVAAEFSDYGDYIWGETAQRAFVLLAEGFSLGGTIHARTANEVVGILHEYLELPLSLLARLGAIITLRVTPGRSRMEEPVRRIESVSLVMPCGKGLALQALASRQQGTDELAFASDKTLQTAISSKFDMVNIRVAAEILVRQQYLERLLNDGKVSRDEVRQAVVEFYAARSNNH